LNTGVDGKAQDEKVMEHKRKEKGKEDKGGPTGWYNHVVGGSIPPVPTRVEKESRQASRREEK
jgi:hypothetical protein